MVQIIMSEDTELRPAQARPVETTSMDQSVGEDQVCGAREGGYNANGGGKPAVEQQGGLGLFPVGEGFLQFVMDTEGPANKAGRTASAPPLFDGLARGSQDGRMPTESKVVIRREVQKGPPLNGQAARSCSIQTPELSSKPIFRHFVQLDTEKVIQGVHGGTCASKD